MRLFDSEDIQKFNENREFAPAEKAVLIARSHIYTVEEKISLWRELVDKYTEEEFQAAEKITMTWWDKESGESPEFREALIQIIEQWEMTLSERYDNQGVVFVAFFGEKWFPRFDWWDGALFDNYDAAYRYLQAEKKYYLEDDDLKNIKTWAKIIRQGISSDENPATETTTYIFDDRLEMVDLYPREGLAVRNHPSLVSEDGSTYDTKWSYSFPKDLVNSCYVKVPLPFKPGDLVKIDDMIQETEYGVFSHEIDEEEENRFIRECLCDGTDMSLMVDRFCNDRVGGYYYTDHTDILSLSYCKEEDLPEGQKKLLYLSLVRKGHMDLIYLLNGELQMVL